MMDLEQQIKEAMGAHGCWKLQLKEAVARGTLQISAEDIARDDLCKFGKWLLKLSEDPDISGSKQFKSVIIAHKRFHQAAGEIADCIENKQIEAAAELLEGAAYQDCSDALCNAMIHFRESQQ